MMYDPDDAISNCMPSGNEVEAGKAASMCRPASASPVARSDSQIHVACETRAAVMDRSSTNCTPPGSIDGSSARGQRWLSLHSLLVDSLSKRPRVRPPEHGTRTHSVGEQRSTAVQVKQVACSQMRPRSLEDGKGRR